MAKSFLLRAGVLLVGLQLSFAQSDPASANRSAAPQTTSEHSGILVKLIGVMAPAEPTPLTERERFQAYVKGVAGVVPVVSAGLSAGFEQWLDHPPEWGQGGAGYGRRLAHGMGFNIVRQTLAYGSSALFHEDDRFMASQRGTTSGRILYALESPVLCHREGHLAFSFSGATGIVGASLISRAWSPSSWQGAGNVGKSAAITYAVSAGVNVFREFVPDIIHRLQK